jgi:hypothetical protein
VGLAVRADRRYPAQSLPGQIVDFLLGEHAHARRLSGRRLGSPERLHVVLAVALVLGGLIMLTLRRQADKPTVARPEAAPAERRTPSGARPGP